MHHSEITQMNPSFNKCEMQIKTSVSEFNGGMQNNKKGLKTLGHIEAKPLSEILSWKIKPYKPSQITCISLSEWLFQITTSSFTL